MVDTWIVEWQLSSTRCLGRIHGVCNHILYCDLVWFQREEGQALSSTHVVAVPVHSLNLFVYSAEGTLLSTVLSHKQANGKALIAPQNDSIQQNMCSRQCLDAPRIPFLVFLDSTTNKTKVPPISASEGLLVSFKRQCQSQNMLKFSEHLLWTLRATILSLLSVCRYSSHSHSHNHMSQSHGC